MKPTHFGKLQVDAQAGGSQKQFASQYTPFEPAGSSG
ncbi:MAG: hypothetical protein ACI9HK_002555, partial [Pirellulaceae bacterium]